MNFYTKYLKRGKLSDKNSARYRGNQLGGMVIGNLYKLG
jgi:hypothetical protein